jgi:hypothetical protein
VSVKQQVNEFIVNYVIACDVAQFIKIAHFAITADNQYFNLSSGLQPV